MKDDFNTLVHTVMTAFVTLAEKHTEDAVAPLLAQLQAVLITLVEGSAEDCGEVANALEKIAIELRRSGIRPGG
jgi:hypothetical protein